MKRILILIPTTAGAMFLTGCAPFLTPSSGSGSSSGFYDFDDSTARNTQEAAMQQNQWDAEQATAIETAAANQTSVDNANAAAAAAAASAAVGIGQ